MFTLSRPGFLTAPPGRPKFSGSTPQPQNVSISKSSLADIIPPEKTYRIPLIPSVEGGMREISGFTLSSPLQANGNFSSMGVPPGSVNISFVNTHFDCVPSPNSRITVIDDKIGDLPKSPKQVELSIGFLSSPLKKRHLLYRSAGLRALGIIPGSGGIGTDYRL